MSEVEAKERYYWSKVRQALKAGMLVSAANWISESDKAAPKLGIKLAMRAGKTFTAGCNALGDPAPTEEKEHD